MSRRPRRDRRYPSPPPGVDVLEPAWSPGRDVRVELAGHVVRQAELRARPERYARWFAQARRHPGYARCRCSPTGERLVIREVAGIFHLARWPQTSDNHHPGCPFATTESRPTGARARTPAITVTAAGTRIAVDYTFATALPGTEPDQDHTPQPPAARDRDGSAAGPAQTATVTGLGLVHWLWESAGLGSWPAGARRRGWDEVHAALLPVLAGMRLGDQPAPTLCHVIAPYRPEVADPAREARLAEFLGRLETPERTVIRGGPRRGRTRQVRHRRLLLGELKDLTATGHGHKLTLRHFPRPVFLTGEQHTDLTRRFPAAFSPRRGPRARRVVLALLEASPHGYLRLVDAAVMLTNDTYLPADSSYEVLMADRLVAAGRGFTKPLRYDRDDAVFPDFVLTDTDPATVVEVYGITGRADYERRKQAKRAHYTREAIPVIAWDVTDPPPSVARDRTSR